MLNNDIRHVDGILMTHSHRDHTAGLDDLRAFNWLNKKAVRIYAEQPVIEVLKQISGMHLPRLSMKAFLI